MTVLRSGLYSGSVFHRRFRPRGHYLKHSLFQLHLDLDELESLDRNLRLFSLNGFNLFSFRPEDHGDGTGDLRGWAQARAAEAGVDLSGGAVSILSIPRILGHAFNPISVYFCRDRTGGLAALIYQVNNTFGERHSYVIAVDDPSASVVRQVCDKNFHVSPFMDLDMIYHFAVQPPGQSVSVRVDASDPEGPRISTAFTGDRRPLTDGALLRAFLSQPLMTLKVVVAIGWGALRLWAKGIAYRPRPAPPSAASTVGRPLGARQAA